MTVYEVKIIEPKETNSDIVKFDVLEELIFKACDINEIVSSKYRNVCK